jgi:hypothetical protein
MKPRIAITKTLSFSALSLSLLASTAFGQLIEITEPNTENNTVSAEPVANSVPQELRSAQQSGMSVQPVTLNAAMSPQVAPQPTLTIGPAQADQKQRPLRSRLN